MKCMKTIVAWLSVMAMMLSMLVASGITVSAISGGGLQGNSSSNVAYGCDLSFWNVGSELDYSLVDFAKMKADGCEFAILRIGYEGSSSRTNAIDKAFLQYYENARAAGMPLGIYFYSLATTYDGAVEDAEWVISLIEQYDMYFEYPIYYDVEDSSQTALGSTAMNNLCLGWCETLEAAGYFPGIYGGMSQVITKLTDTFKATYDVWYPAVLTNGHGSQYSPETRNYSDRCSMWQYAWYDYEYNGIGLDMLDVNVAYKDYPAIMEEYGYNNCGYGSSASKIGTYEITASSLNVREGVGTSYSIVDTLSTGDVVAVSELSNGWGKLVTPDGVEGWAAVASYGDYIGIDALAYDSGAVWGDYEVSVDSDGRLTIVNKSTTDTVGYDFRLPQSIGTSTTPYMSLQVNPNYGNGYYFGITQSGSGYFMMRDCMSGDELVAESSAPYMTGLETLEINVKEWWKPSEAYKIDTVRFYVAPSSSITINYFYFADQSGKVVDTTYNLRKGSSEVVLNNETLMDPATLDIADRTKSGSYTYNNGVLTVTADTAAGFDVVFNVNKSFDINAFKRFLVTIDAATSFNVSLTVTHAGGTGTMSLSSDFYPSFTSSYPADGYIPAPWSGSAGLDLYNYYSYNNVIPSDGVSTITQVKVSLGSQGTSTFSALQIAGTDQLATFADGIVKSDINTVSDDTEKVILDSDVYTISSDGYITGVTAQTDLAAFLANLTSDYTVSVYENGAAASGDVKTCQVLKVLDGTTELASYEIVVKGDVNCDGKVNSSDAREIVLSVVGTALSGTKALAADYDASGAVASSDARAILSALIL